MLWKPDEKFFTGEWFYYSGFAISNIVFSVLVVALFVTRKSRKFRTVVAVIFFLHVLSWVVLHVFDQAGGLAHIKIGYYVWLMAYGLLVAAHLWKEPGESLG